MKSSGCPICNEPIHIMYGPEEYIYDHKTCKVYHRQCFEEKQEENEVKVESGVKV